MNAAPASAVLMLALLAGCMAGAPAAVGPAPFTSADGGGPAGADESPQQASSPASACVDGTERLERFGVALLRPCEPTAACWGRVCAGPATHRTTRDADLVAQQGDVQLLLRRGGLPALLVQQDGVLDAVFVSDEAYVACAWLEDGQPVLLANRPAEWMGDAPVTVDGGARLRFDTATRTLELDGPELHRCPT